MGGKGFPLGQAGWGRNRSLIKLEKSIGFNPLIFLLFLKHRDRELKSSFVPKTPESRFLMPGFHVRGTSLTILPAGGSPDPVQHHCPNPHGCHRVVATGKG